MILAFKSLPYSNPSLFSFQEIQKKLPEESCEAEKMAYFSMPIENLADLKEAKLHWKALFECSKLEEAKLNIRRTL